MKKPLQSMTRNEGRVRRSQSPRRLIDQVRKSSANSVSALNSKPRASAYLTDLTLPHTGSSVSPSSAAPAQAGAIGGDGVGADHPQLHDAMARGWGSDDDGGGDSEWDRFTSSSGGSSSRQPHGDDGDAEEDAGMAGDTLLPSAAEAAVAGGARRRSGRRGSSSGASRRSSGSNMADDDSSSSVGGGSSSLSGRRSHRSSSSRLHAHFADGTVPAAVAAMESGGVLPPGPGVVSLLPVPPLSAAARDASAGLGLLLLGGGAAAPLGAGLPGASAASAGLGPPWAVAGGGEGGQGATAAVVRPFDAHDAESCASQRSGFEAHRKQHYTNEFARVRAAAAALAAADDEGAGEEGGTEGAARMEGLDEA
jgi:hypothetical protein